MLASHFIFGIRSMRKHKVYSLINIAGLSMGMMLCLLILNYVQFEKSYDRFFHRYEDIVRVGYSKFIDNELQYSKAQVFPLVGEVLGNSIPEIEGFTRLFPITTHIEAVLSLESNGEKKIFLESGLYATDSSFLKVFRMPLLAGDPASALVGEKKIILSESISHKYFGYEEPLNKTIHWEGMGDFVVTGVFRDLPENSHMNFEILVSWINVYESGGWNWDGFYNYLLLDSATDYSSVEHSAQVVMNKKMEEINAGTRIASEFFLQPLADIHLHSKLNGEMRTNGDARVVNTLQFVAFVILGMAFINYMNLSVARGVRRAKEIGVRRVIGSKRRHLLSLFITEAFTMCLIALSFSIVLWFLLSPVIDTLTGKTVKYIIWNQPLIFGAFVLCSLLILSILSIIYPALILSSFNPVNALKGGNFSINGGQSFKKILLTIQFATTIILVTCGLLVDQQISFMQNQDLGFQLNHNVVIRSLAGPGDEMDSLFTTQIKLFKRKVLENIRVVNATITSNIPGRENDWQGRLVPPEKKDLITTYRTRVDSDFIDTYGLSLVAGRNFVDENRKQVILNESAVEMLGFKNANEALGNLALGDSEIIGVIRDFHERSLKEPIMPSIFSPGTGYMKFVTIKVHSSEVGKTIRFLENEWREIFPDKPFEYFFLDEFFNKQYLLEERVSSTLTYFSVIAIGIACLGLFGFTYFMISQRIKEIGIRKTLGASFLNLTHLLTSEFFFLLALSSLLAVPISYVIAENWLSRYPTRINLHAFNFITPALLVAILAISSIMILLIQAIRKKPSDALKYE